MAISEGPITTSTTGFTILGQEVVIATDITGTTANNPLVIVFALDASLIPPGENQDTIAILKNGVPLQNCNVFPGSTIANPDPCVSDRVLLSGGAIQITVLTSTASVWNFGVATATPTATPTPTPTPTHTAAPTRTPTPTPTRECDHNGNGDDHHKPCCKDDDGKGHGGDEHHKPCCKDDDGKGHGGDDHWPRAFRFFGQDRSCHGPDHQGT